MKKQTMMNKFLKDIQNLEDNRGIDIQKVGVKDVALPLNIQRKGASNQIVSAKARMSVSLSKNFKGTHMSRFVEVLNIWGQKGLQGVDVKKCLIDIKKKLNANCAEVKFTFKYFIDKKAPVSGYTSQMGYDCSFEGLLDGNDYKFFLGAKIPVTTLCPCSKEISEYGAHNQRALISLKVQYAENAHIWLEDLIKEVENCGSSKIYPLLKREDEKYVTEKAYENPKFVEDVLRDVVLTLKTFKEIKHAKIEIEAFESIHNHSAWAYQEI